MSVQAPARVVSLRPGPRRALAAVCTLLSAMCLLALVRDSLWRRTAAALALDQGLARRQPAVVETAGVLEQSGDAATIVAEGLLDEWAGAPGSPEESAVRKVQGLLLEAVARRPGAAQGRLLLGRSAPANGSSRLWARPLELAAVAAPGLDAPPATLAQRYLAAWSILPAGDRAKGEAALRRAFRRPDFLRSSLVLAVDVVGAETAVRLLPNDAAVLRAAAQILRGSAAGRASELVAVRLDAIRPAPPSVPSLP